MQTEFMTARQLSETYFGGVIDYKNVLRLTREGHLPAIKQGKKYVYERGAIDLWVEKNFSTPAFAKLKKA